MPERKRFFLIDVFTYGYLSWFFVCVHLSLDYDYLRSETDFTGMEEMEEAEGMEKMEEMELRSPHHYARRRSSSTNNLPSSVIFLVLVAAIAGNANLITFVINLPDICQFWDTTALFNPVKVHQKKRNFTK